MSRYQKNKGFLPKGFLEEKKSKNEKSDSRGIVCLLVLNMFFLPLTLKNIRQLRVNEEEYKEIYIDEKVNIEKESILKWLNQLDDTVYQMQIDNGNGEIEVYNTEKICSIEKSDSIEIRSMIKNDNGRYIINVSKEE